MAISLGGGGSNSQINEVILLRSNENVVTLADGRVYLKAGVIETTQSTYPDAVYGINFNGNSYVHDNSINGGYGGDIAWDGTYYWIASDYSDYVKRFSSTGGTGTNGFSISAQHSSVSGITYDGTSLWLCGGANDRVSKWSTGGSYQGVNFSTASQDNAPTAITWDGSHLWVLGDQNDAVYKYNTSGTYQNVSFSVASQAINPKGLSWDGSNFWVLDDTSKKVYKYNSSGVYQNVSFAVQEPYNYVRGLVWNGSKHVVLDGYATFYEYQSSYGLPRVPAAGSHAMTSEMVYLGAEAYVRVK
jgi:hypothetical protein